MKYSSKLVIGGVVILGLVILFIAVGTNPFTSDEKLVSPTPTPPKQIVENQQGYQWAEDNDITDVTQCEGKPKAFQQGCVNYIHDHIDDGLQDQDTADE